MDGIDPIEAHLDPWLTVPTETVGYHLFGFAHRHPKTGGLAWLRSTLVVNIDEANGRAQTKSGRVYSLGRRIEPEDLPDDEAKLAYVLLLCPYTLPPHARDHAIAWITSRKMARHLAVSPPDFGDPEGVLDYVEQHRHAYRVALAQARSR